METLVLTRKIKDPIKDLLSRYYNQALQETNHFVSTAFSHWLFKKIHAGNIVLPEGMDEYDVLEAADRY